MGIIDADTHIDETDATRKPEKVLRAVTSVRGDTPSRLLKNSVAGCSKRSQRRGARKIDERRRT